MKPRNGCGLPLTHLFQEARQRLLSRHTGKTARPTDSKIAPPTLAECFIWPQTARIKTLVSQRPTVLEFLRHSSAMRSRAIHHFIHVQRHQWLRPTPRFFCRLVEKLLRPGPYYHVSIRDLRSIFQKYQPTWLIATEMVSFTNAGNENIVTSVDTGNRCFYGGRGASVDQMTTSGALTTQCGVELQRWRPKKAFPSTPATCRGWGLGSAFVLDISAGLQ